MDKIGYISREDLASTFIAAKRPGIDYLVVDVRDEDRRGGHIVHSVNIPAHEFTADVRRHAEQHRLGSVPVLIFHCALSQVRGPKSAAAYVREGGREICAAGEAASVGDVPQGAQKVFVLRGGFVKFQEKFGKVKDFVAEYDEDLWASGYAY